MAGAETAVSQLSLDPLGNVENFEALANHVARICAGLAQAEICTLWRVFKDGSARQLKLAGSHGIVAPQMVAQETLYPIAAPSQDSYEGLTSYIASNRVAVRVDSYEQLRTEFKFCHRGLMDRVQWEGDPSTRMRNLCGLPVLLGDQLVGVLKVENRLNSDRFSDSDEEALRGFVGTVALVLKALTLLDSYEQRLIDVPVELSSALVKRPFEAGVAQDIVNATAHALNAGVCSLWIVDEKREQLIHHASYGVKGGSANESVPSYRIDVSPPDTPEGDEQIEGVTAWVAIRRRSFWANTHKKLQEHPSWRGKWDSKMYGGRSGAEREFHSMYAVPLIWNAELLGVLKVENSLGQKYFSQNDRRKCDLMANYVVLLLALARQLRLQLIPSIAHNLGGPARGIARNLEMLTRELGKPEPSMDRIRQLTEMMKVTTLTLLTMSRTLAAEVASQGASQQPQPTDILGTVRDTVKLVEPLLPPGQKVLLEVQDMLQMVFPMTPSEVVWLQIILFNLLTNASKYGPTPGKIRLACCSRGRQTVIAVADEGNGVPPEAKSQIFEPGVRGRNTGKAEGLGLGLFEVKRLADLLKWEIKLEDENPHGARFEILIPQDWRHYV
jgi:signal transduction histidine kinase